MRRLLVSVLAAGAGCYAVWQAMRLAFVPVGTQATISNGVEATEQTYAVVGILILVLVLVAYTALAHTLYRSRYGAFHVIAAAHIIASALSLPSSGSRFVVSSGLLLVAIILPLGVSEAKGRPQAGACTSRRRV